MFGDTEAEVASFREVSLAQFVFLDLEATLEDFLGLGSADGDVNGDFLVTTDAKGSHGVAGFACRKQKWITLVDLVPQYNVFGSHF